jgi:hypothetical protein
MSLRFVTWTDLGSVTFRPTDQVVDVGEVTLVEGATTLWIRVTQLSGATPWPWSYGIAAFESIEGRPLGSVKAYGHPDGEVVQLGVGLPPVERTGSLVFEPRGFNLAWIRNGNPWELNFEVRSGTPSITTSVAGPVRFPFTDLTNDIPFVLAPGNAQSRLDFR